MKNNYIFALLIVLLINYVIAFRPSLNAIAKYSNNIINKKYNSKYVSSSSLLMAVTDAPPVKLDISPMAGMFTNSSPETKRVIPINAENKTKMKIVYVVLESQYQSSLTQACNSINEGKEGVAVEAVGYLLEELRSPAVFEQFKQDVADANIFIGSLIFVQELADKVYIFIAINSSYNNTYYYY